MSGEGLAAENERRQLAAWNEHKRPGPSLKPLRPAFAVDVYGPDGAIAATVYGATDYAAWGCAFATAQALYPVNAISSDLSQRRVLVSA